LTARFRQRQVYPTGQGQDERAMGQGKEALRAAIEEGPRAALTREGMPEVPEPSEKHGLVKGEQSASCANRYAAWPCGVGMKRAQLAQQDDQQNSSKSVPDSLLTLQPIGGGRIVICGARPAPDQSSIVKPILTVTCQ
jgi:hypothetical protein